jgi:hypothetical protein
MSCRVSVLGTPEYAKAVSALTIALSDAVVMFESRPTPQVVPGSAPTST